MNRSASGNMDLPQATFLSDWRSIAHAHVSKVTPNVDLVTSNNEVNSCGSSDLFCVMDAFHTVFAVVSLCHLSKSLTI